VQRSRTRLVDAALIALDVAVGDLGSTLLADAHMASRRAASKLAAVPSEFDFPDDQCLAAFGVATNEPSVDTEPQFRKFRPALPLPLAEVAAAGLGGLVAVRGRRGPAALAEDVGEVLVEVDVVDGELGELVEAHAGVDRRSLLRLSVWVSPSLTTQPTACRPLSGLRAFWPGH
jgi:hypothetical protein